MKNDRNTEWKGIEANDQEWLQFIVNDRKSLGLIVNDMIRWWMAGDYGN